jgi:phenylacetate-CoA ligase
MSPFTPFAEARERVQALIAQRAPEHLARLSWSAEQIAACQRDRLRALLAHAKERSPFHARRLADVDPARFELADLRALPVMTKADLMGAFDDVVTDRRLGRGLAEEALAATGTEPVPLFGEYVCMSSGGSSGVRGVFALDLSAMADFILSINRQPMRRMLASGGLPPGGVTLALVAARSAVHATGGAASWTAGGAVHYACVPVTLPLEEIVAELNRIQPFGLGGYPSMLARLARERCAGRLRIAPTSVSCTSENLLPEWREAIAKGFGVPVVNVFGSTEGLVGVSEPDELPLSFNSDFCIVELVDETGAPVPDGAPSARILLTNLANRAQPLIRYAIDDRVVRHAPAAGHGHLRATVEGRSGDVLSFGATEIHPLVIRSVLTHTRAAVDYQVRQTARGIDVAVLADGPLDVEHLRGALASALSGAGLANPEVAVRRVPALERHGDTGKLRRVIPLG